jgi:hypothetical protein
LLEDPVLREAHRRMLPRDAPARPDAIDVALAVGRARLEAALAPAAALAAMTPAERLACLSDPAALDQLVALATSHPNAATASGHDVRA